jgi:hypothetical protein
MRACVFVATLLTAATGEADTLFHQFQDQQMDSMPSYGSWTGPLPSVNVGFTVWGPPDYSSWASILFVEVSATDVGRTFVMPPEEVEGMQGFGSDPRPVAVYSTISWDCTIVSQNCRIGNNHSFPFPPVPAGTRFSRVELTLDRLDIEILHRSEYPPDHYSANLVGSYTARFYVVPEPEMHTLLAFWLGAFFPTHRNRVIMPPQAT